MEFKVTIIQEVKYREECVFTFNDINCALSFMQTAISTSPENTEVRLTAVMRKEEADESIQAPESR